jgi:hypothetical protein
MSEAAPHDDAGQHAEAEKEETLFPGSLVPDRCSNPVDFGDLAPIPPPLTVISTPTGVPNPAWRGNLI